MQVQAGDRVSWLASLRQDNVRAWRPEHRLPDRIVCFRISRVSALWLIPAGVTISPRIVAAGPHWSHVSDTS